MASPLEVKAIVSMPFGENTYVVWRPDRRDALVIDPGLEPDKILNFLGQRVGDILAYDGLLVLDNDLLIARRAHRQPAQRQAGQQDGGEKDPGGAAHQTVTMFVVRILSLILCRLRGSAKGFVTTLRRAPLSRSLRCCQSR